MVLSILNIKFMLLIFDVLRTKKNTVQYFGLEYSSGQKISTRPPVRDEYSRISDEWISKSTCPTGRVEFA